MNCPWIWGCHQSLVNRLWPSICFLCPEIHRRHLHRPTRPPTQRRAQGALTGNPRAELKRDQKGEKAKAVARTHQQLSSTRPWRLRRSSGCAGHSTYLLDAAAANQVKAVPREYTCVQSRGASSPTRFKTADEAKRVSPQADLSMESRSAKFLPSKFSLGQPG